MTVITGIDPHSGKVIDVLVDGNAISEIRDSTSNAECYISPGWIDLQVNGFGGYDLNEPNLKPETVLGVCEAVLCTGVTRFLATLITQSEAHLITSLQTIRNAMERFPLVFKMVAGVHMEGPFISPEDGARGAHPIEHVRPPSLDEVDRWQAASGDLIRIITLSPHWDNSAVVIAGITQRGIHVSIGHTHATAPQIHAAADAGARLSTHLGNGAPGTLPRHPNMIWAQLADDRLFASFIADGHHLDRDTLSAMLRCKGLERSILVSDAVALAGLPPGIYDASIGGRVELSSEGRLGIQGTPYLAGAIRSIGDCLGWLLLATGISLHDAIKLCTANPASFLSEGGDLQVGAPADLVLFKINRGYEITLTEVYLDGQRMQLIERTQNISARA